MKVRRLALIPNVQNKRALNGLPWRFECNLFSYSLLITLILSNQLHTAAPFSLLFFLSAREEKMWFIRPNADVDVYLKKDKQEFVAGRSCKRTDYCEASDNLKKTKVWRQKREKSLKLAGPTERSAAKNWLSANKRQEMCFSVVPSQKLDPLCDST